MCNLSYIINLTCYKLNRCYIKLSLVNILEMVFVFIEILFKMLLFKGGVLIYAEHCIFIYMCVCVCVCVYIVGHQRESDNLRSIQIGVRITKKAKFHKEAQDNRMFVNS